MLDKGQLVLELWLAIQKKEHSLNYAGVHRWGPAEYLDSIVIHPSPLRETTFFASSLVFAKARERRVCLDCGSIRDRMYYYQATAMHAKPLWCPNYSCSYKTSAAPCMPKSKTACKLENAKEERLREKQQESFLQLVDAIPMERYRNLQVTHNLKIVLSPSVSSRSLRYAAAVYRLVELGIDHHTLQALLGSRGRPGVLMLWYEVKKTLCLKDSSCGLREFFL